VSRLIREEATVALGGDGGDELFGGYPHHAWIQGQQQWRRLIPGPLRSALRPVAPHLLPVGLRGRNFALGLLGNQSQAVAQFNQLFDPATRARLSPLLRKGGAGLAERAKERHGWTGATALQQATVTDFCTYLPEDILVKVDRASMLCSLEVRAPFLDPALIAFAFSGVPDALRATRDARKILPRRLAARLLPPALDLQRKQGFSLPLSEWFEGQWGGYMDDVLRAADPDVLDPRAVDSLLKGQRRGYTNEHRLFALTMLELWRREYGVTTA
jgi:asparagine synthase (glutamine-hydrolysing)